MERILSVAHILSVERILAMKHPFNAVYPVNDQWTPLITVWREAWKEKSINGFPSKDEKESLSSVGPALELFQRTRKGHRHVVRPALELFQRTREGYGPAVGPTLELFQKQHRGNIRGTLYRAYGISRARSYDPEFNWSEWTVIQAFTDDVVYPERHLRCSGSLASGARREKDPWCHLNVLWCLQHWSGQLGQCVYNSDVHFSQSPKTSMAARPMCVLLCCPLL